MLKIKTILKYLQLRFKPNPWLILPLIYFCMSISHISQFSLSKLFYAYIFLIAFRLFDDIFCMTYDMQKKESRFYYQQIYKNDLIMFDLLFFFILFSSIYFIFNESVLYLHLGILLISLSLYRFFLHSRLVLFISILKYPVFIYSLGDGRNESIMWACFIFLVLMIKELMDEKVVKNINTIKYGLILLTFMVKGIEWSNS